jgi:hypothetical protein
MRKEVIVPEQEVMVDVTIDVDDAWEDYGGRREQFIVDAFTACGANVEDVLDFACDDSKKDAVNWVINNTPLKVILSNYKNIDTTTSALFVDLMKKLIDNMDKFQIYDIDELEKYLTEKRLI